MKTVLIIGLAAYGFIHFYGPGRVVASSALSGVDHIQTDNYANTELGYYYYIPAKVAKMQGIQHPLIVCVPGLSGSGESCVDQQMKDFADEVGAVILAPSFKWDEANWASQTSYQYPAAWSGEALLSMVGKLSQRFNLRFSKFCLFGSSAGAQFCLRFALWKPELTLACASHAAGGRIIPTAYSPVKFLIGVGRDDHEDRRRYAREFCEEAARLKIDVECKSYDAGHNLLPEQVQDGLALFRQVMKR